MEAQEFAAVMAQVIPVVLLATLAELAGVHRVYQNLTQEVRASPGDRRRKSAPATTVAVPDLSAMRRRLPWTLLVQFGVVGALIVLEIAAIAVSGSKAPDRLALQLMRPEVAGGLVGCGFAVTLLFAAMSLGHAYRTVGLLSDEAYFAVRLGVAVVLLVCLTAVARFF